MEAPVVESAADYPLSRLAAVFTQGFEGYAIPMRMTPEALAQRVAAEDIDLCASRVLVRDGAPAGLALIARRGRESRLAAMGVRADARRGGVGRALLERVVAEARARGDSRMRLEVFESNAAARALYERAGFTRTMRLVGYEARLEPAAADLHERDPADFARQLAGALPGPLPWQLDPASLSAPPSGARCFALGGKSFAYLTGVNDKAILVRGLFTVPAHRRAGNARRLLRGLADRFPGRIVAVAQLIPEGLAAGFWSALGFRQAELTQLELELVL